MRNRRWCQAVRVTVGVVLLSALLWVSGSNPAYAGSNEWTSIGPDGGVITTLAIDPITPTTLYAGTTGGVFKSTDGGVSWSASNAGLWDYESITTLTIDPQTPSTLYVGTYYHGVFKSTDGGASWSAMNAGRFNVFTELPDYESITTLAIDPQTPSTLYYAGTFADYITAFRHFRVFKSIDGGASWSEMLGDWHVRTLAIDPQTPSTLYAGGYDFGGVFKSTDGGVSWSAMNAGLGVPPVPTLAIDPQTPSTLYAGTDRGGVFKSTDGGESWRAMNGGLPENSVGPLAIDPQTPSTLYAGTFADGVFRSTDGGASWWPMNAGLNELVVLSLAIDPSTPSTLYAGTSTGVFVLHTVWDLTVINAGTGSNASTGSGIVTSNPGGIDCGQDCSESYTNNTIVTLTAHPDASSTFDGWSGDPDCTDGSVTMDGPKGCMAMFTRITHTLTVITTGTGSGIVTSNPGGIDCGLDCSQPYAHSSTVTLTATPARDSTFGGWSGDPDCTDGSLTMDANKSCTATFTLTHTLTVSKGGTGSGTVTSDSGGIDCGKDCSNSYPHNIPVTLTATPATGSTFGGWSGDPDCADGSVTMDADKSCTATFTLVHTLTVSKAGTGSGIVTSNPGGITCGYDCSESYAHNMSVTLVATPAAGSTFGGWSGDSDCTDGSVTMDADESCRVTFTFNTFTLTYTAGAGGTISGSTPQTVTSGESGTAVSAIPNTGYHFTSWSDGSLANPRTDANVTANLSLTANFAIDTYTLTVNTAGTGTGTVGGGGVYDYNTVVTLTATPAAGSVFVRWMGHCNSLEQVTLDADKSCTAIFMLTTPAVTWAKYYGGTGYETAASIQQTTDGGYIVAGETDSSGVGADVWLLKLDAGGAVEWQKEYRESYAQHASSIQQTTDGGYIVAGRTAHGNDAWVLKLDSIGAIQWQRRYGGASQDWANSIQQTTDGGYIVAGVANYGVNADAWILKLDGTGAIQWQKTYGGTLDDRANSIQQTTDGGYIVAGHMNFLTDGQDAWILKLDGTGTIQWQKTYSETNRANSIQQTTDGGYIVAGYRSSPDGGLVLKLDGAGAIQWQHAYREGTSYSETHSVQQTADGSYIVAGRGANDTWVLKLDGIGTTEWRYRYGGTGSDQAYSIQQTADGGYIVAGGTTSFGYISDVWVLKLDNLGNISDCTAQETATATAFNRSITETVTTSLGVTPAFTANVTAAISYTTTAYEPLVCPALAPATYTLTYTADAGGTISGSTPQTVTHGGNGTAVSAIPNAGYHFTNWTDGSTANPRTDTTVTGNITVTANFAINTYTLTYTAGAGGTISGSTPQTVTHGGNGTAVSAIPNAGYHFTNWTDGSTANPRTDTTVTANLSVTVNFAIDTYTLTVNTTGTGAGTIGGGGVYDYNTVVTLTATPAAGSSFNGWSGDLDCADGSVTMNANKSCAATFNALNSAPVADAGPAQSAYVGDIVTLDGSGSTDADGDLLTYAWAFTTKPTGSTATLSSATAVTPTFPVDKPGTYVVSLVVHDGTVASSNTATVTISTLNSAPVAHAGLAQSAYVGSVVTLDGSGSTDADGDLLTYAWAFTTKPTGSTATLSSATAVTPTFPVDKPGTYVVSLVVHDGTVASSNTATVTISTINVAPVADAGQDQSITIIGATVQLDGSQSYDPDGDSITYEWSLVSKPAGSQAALAGANTATPSFVADMHGDYVAQLIVTDAALSSTDTVTVSFDNIKPVANAGASQSVSVGDTVTLDGTHSTDANGDTLTYAWTFSSLPSGSAASIVSPTDPVTSFVPDLAGTYTVQLVVNDGFMDSDPSTSQVQVVSAQSAAIAAIQRTQALIASLSPSDFKNANMQNALLNKLNAVIANVEAGNYADALGQLQHDILAKTDGCTASNKPDKNDWLTNCTAQGILYPSVLDSIAAVERLL